MKKSCKAILSLFLVLLLAVSLASAAAAAAPSITFRGFSGGFDFQPGSEYTLTDLFDNFKNVMPGDSLTETITFTNSASDCDFVNLYLRFEPHDEAANPLTYDEKFENEDGKDQANVSGQRDETVATMADFLSRLTMRVYNGTQLIYVSSPDQAGGLRDNRLLGTLRSGEKAALRVELDVPIDLGNEYANRVGEVDWVFHVEAFNESQRTVRKIWSDGNANHAGETVTVNLLKDGELDQSQVLSAANGWVYTFDRLAEGHTWTVEEAAVPEGYTVSYQTVGTTTTITNTRNTPVEPSTPLDITVYKVWSGDLAAQRPESVTVTLYNGAVPYATVRLGAWNNWSYSWKDMNAYGNWQVVETNITKGYVPSYRVSGGVVTITNTRSLIQTGQLNWPIWVLCGAGLALVALGGAMLVKKKKNA